MYLGRSLLSVSSNATALSPQSLCFISFFPRTCDIYGKLLTGLIPVRMMTHVGRKRANLCSMWCATFYVES